MLPPGTYFVGDPIFALSDAHLAEMTQQLGRGGSSLFEIEGHQGWVAVTPLEEMTAVSSSDMYEIQSGRLAVIPMELVKDDDSLEVVLDDVGDTKTFKRVFTCEEGPSAIVVGRTHISLEPSDNDDDQESELDFDYY